MTFLGVLVKIIKVGAVIEKLRNKLTQLILN